MGWTYGEKPGHMRRAELAAAALTAEWDIPDGPFQRLIRQKRRHALIASTRAMWLFALLVFVIFLGLAFYLGLPFWTQYVDGRRQTLTQTVENIDEVLTGIGEQIDAQIALFEGALKRSFTLQEVPGKEWISGSARTEDGFIFYRSDGLMFRTNLDGTPKDNANQRASSREWIVGHFLYRDALRFYTTDGTILEYGAGASQTRPLHTITLPGLFSAVLGHVEVPGGLIFYGPGGAFVRTEADGSPLPEQLGLTPTAGSINGHLEYDGGILFYGDGGPLFRTTSDGTLEDAVLIDRPRLQLEELFRERTDGLPGYTIDKMSILPPSPEDVAKTPALPEPPTVNFNGHVAISDGILFYGSGAQALVKASSVGEIVEDWQVETPVDFVIQGHVRLPDALWFYGSDGLIFRTDFDGVPTRDPVIRTPTSRVISGHAELDDGIIFYGPDGLLMLVSDGSAKDALRRIATESEAASDGPRPPSEIATRAQRLSAVAAAITNVIEEDLQPHQAAVAEIVTIRGIAGNLLGQIEALYVRLRRAEDSLERLNHFPNALMLEDERRDFAGFMQICRGSAKPVENTQENPADRAADPLTLACLEGWKAQMATEQQSWWQTLAEKVPPGILLLFLLATLGGLYRYNMRLAGFHHSRADALELLATTGGFDAATLTQVADALAADKVEFGKGSTPSDQAVEIAKAIAARR